jgi:hypothetical protein
LEILRSVTLDTGRFSEKSRELYSQLQQTEIKT